MSDYDVDTLIDDVYEDVMVSEGNQGYRDNTQSVYPGVSSYSHDPDYLTTDQLQRFFLLQPDIAKDVYSTLGLNKGDGMPLAEYNRVMKLHDIPDWYSRWLLDE